MLMITVENVTFAYARRKPPVLSGFSLTLRAGRVYGLLGKNGVGKSTLLYLMSGLLTPRSGRVAYRGTDVRRRLPETLGDIFLVPEEFELPPVPLADYVRLNACFYPRFSRDDMNRYLESFGLDKNLHLKALSMGQKKKVFMSFALAANTPLLLMDEPTNGLDIPAKSQFRGIVAQAMSDERTMVISTHQIRDIDRSLDHVLLMDNRRVLLDASIDELGQRLLFAESNGGELPPDTLYAQPSLHGQSLLRPNTEGEETEVNLELLFNAVLSAPEKITACIHPKTDER